MIDFGERPIAHRLLERADETEKIFGLALHVCEDCGLVQLLDPIDPAILYTGYNYNFSSWKPEPHMADELDALSAANPFRRVVEIGCNDGKFLQGLMSRRMVTGIGVEPNPVSGAMARDLGIHVYADMIKASVCDEILHDHGEADLVIARQVIEHVPDLDNFFSCIDKLIGAEGFLFLDMPDFEPSLMTADCSTIWEEHVSYFAEPSILRVLSHYDLAPVDMRRYDFSGGCLAVLARRTDSTDDYSASVDETRKIVDMARKYGRAVRDYELALRRELMAARTKGLNVVLYGAGVRGCGILNSLDLDGLIDFAVDDQPERQGKFMPGGRLPIRQSTVLGGGSGPLVCLLAVNNESEEKVKANVNGISDRPTIFVSLCSPKDIHAELAPLREITGT